MIIGYDMGHGLEGYPNSGAKGKISESVETRVLGNLAISKLKKLGHTVVNCTVDRPASNSDSISKRIALANAQKLDIFVSLHFNSGGGHGVEVLTVNAKYMVQADRFLKSMEKIGFKNRGIKTALTSKGDPVGVVHKTNAPAMLIETCFVDSEYDTLLYKQNIDKIADAIVYGITGQIAKGDEEDMIPTLRLSACAHNPLKEHYIAEIKLLQGVAGLAQNGIATEELCMKLPVFKGGESRGSASVLQTLLMLKGYLSGSDDRPALGTSVKSAVDNLRRNAGLPASTHITDPHVWRVLLEY